MGSSHGFGSNPSDLPCGCALFGLAFALAPQISLLNLTTKIHSPDHSSIGTLSSIRRRTPTVCRHAVSGTFNSPPGVLFHLSLTVLLHYRSLGVFSLGKWSSQLPTAFLVCRGTQEQNKGGSFLSLTRLSLSSAALSRVLLLDKSFVTPRRDSGPPTFALQHRYGIGSCAVTFHSGLSFSPFARRY